MKRCGGGSYWAAPGSLCSYSLLALDSELENDNIQYNNNIIYKLVALSTISIIPWPHLQMAIIDSSRFF